MHAIANKSGTEAVKELPGLRSVAKATIQLASIMARPRAYSSRNEKAVRGSKVATTPLSDIALIPLSDAWSKWSADNIFSSAANSAPPNCTISSACIFNRNPCSRAAVRNRRDCSMVNTFFSQNMSAHSANFSFATKGNISLMLKSINSSSLPFHSAGVACGPINVDTMSIV